VPLNSLSIRGEDEKVNESMKKENVGLNTDKNLIDGLIHY